MDAHPLLNLRGCSGIASNGPANALPGRTYGDRKRRRVPDRLPPVPNQLPALCAEA